MTGAQEAVNIMQGEYGVDFSPSMWSRRPGISHPSPRRRLDRRAVGAPLASRDRGAGRRRFDFMAHEIGHAFDIHHSFGSILFQTSGEGPGGYAHPYCIMSAMAYGNLAAPYFPSPPRNNWPEYAPLGPRSMP